jgi:type IV pilus assembly protein PilV
MPKTQYCNSTGFSLIEVLVSMVILAIGLLGLGALQGISLKNNQDAYLYSQANSLAYEMSDRIKANKTGWISISPPSSSCQNNCNSSTNSCNPAEMAAYDYCKWKINTATALSSGVTAVILKSSVSGSTACPGNASELCLRISWNKINQKNLQSKSSLELEITP